MKKYNCLLALLVSVFLLLCACAQQQSSQASSNPDSLSSAPTSSAPTSVPPTDASTTPTETNPTTLPTESIPPLLEPDVWQPADFPLSYEEYFSQDRLFLPRKTSWLAESDHGYIICRVRMNTGRLIVYSDAVEGTYVVPCQENFSNYGLLAADGAFAYLYGLGDIVQVDLLTGDKIVLCTNQNNPTLLDCRVLYYSELEADSVKICRKYLPTGTVDVLQTIPLEGTPESWLHVNTPQSTQGKLTWYMMNPALMVQLNEELANPNSKYKTRNNPNLSRYWQNSSTLWKYDWEWDTPQFILSHWLQEDTDIPAFVQYTVDQATGSATQSFGIIDTCWYGSGWNHDHFEPEITEVHEPTVLMTDWTAILPDSPSPQSPSPEEMYNEADNEGDLYWADRYSVSSLPGNLFVLEDGIATPIWDTQVRNVINSQYYIYCIANGNKVYQLSYDGRFVQPLYVGKDTLHNLCYSKGTLCLQDGSTIIEIDVPQLQYRAVLEHPEVDSIYFTGETDNFLRIEIYAGLLEIDYHYYPATGELIKNHPWL